MPPTNGETKKQKSSAMPVFLVLLFGATFVAGYKVGATKAGQGGSGYDAGYAAGIAATSEKLRTAGLLPETRPITSLSGTVTAIDEGGMTVEVGQAVTNPLEDPAPTVRTVRFTKETAFAEIVPKSPLELQKELDAVKKPTDAATPAPLPVVDPFTKKPLKPSDIVVGATVTVTAAEDILRTPVFDGVEIQLVLRPVPQLGAPQAPDDFAPEAAVPPLTPPTTAPPSKP